MYDPKFTVAETLELKSIALVSMRQEPFNWALEEKLALVVCAWTKETNNDNIKNNVFF